MRRQEQGFTLIELVIVLVILGILAAVAIPRFENFSSDAKAAAVSGGRSSVASALAIEMAKNKAAPTGNQVATRLPGSSCEAGVGIRIPGSTATQAVQIPLLNDNGTSTLADCTSASVYAVGQGTFSG